ncbi:DEAD/DEAH box helicase [Lactococcus lactis]|uniref:DEAD/DEAH box helicase n=1 Tax=Lactococcus lactis TaxID=1358 RepID=A0AAP3Z105_9LACT|nr:DEAD/DEAH box helicase [Lactococcus lactis]MDG4968265.1 DEAD/DEAH box helicase [Lactococcus lactis]MDG4976375.1 DEAD/DEAH box helicase [Lactococcus lactis]MDG5102179.1 DEAD/DEAH box helicase [Lactococcus lactis]
MKAILHDYQDYCVNFILSHESSALLLDMGLGKTLISLTAIKELKDFGLLGKCLIIAPLTVAKDTWPKEIVKWDHLEGLTSSLIIGNKNQRLAGLAAKADIYITNKENFVWLTENHKWDFDTVIIDELSGFKATNTKRFKAMRKVRPKVKRMVGLTGTPAPNSLLDLWPQMYTVDMGDSLGKSVTQFRESFFYPVQSNGHIVYKWALKDGAEEMIYDKIAKNAVSMRAKDHLNLPERVDNVIEVELSNKEKLQYQQLKRDFILEIANQEIMAPNAASLGNKLLQLAQGAMYTTDKEVLNIHEQKKEALDRIIEEANGQPVLIFYWFKFDKERLLNWYPQAQDISTDKITAWNNGEIPIMIAHPASSGHGLNLQAGGHIIVWYGINWSAEYYAQANARLDRQGQTESVIVHHIITKDTEDERALQVVQGKITQQEALMEAVKAEMELIK